MNKKFASRWARIGAMIFKEVRQASRDPGTMAMMFAMPIMQLLLFGFAINTDPRHLPLAIEANANSAFTRSIAGALNNTSYFEVRRIVTEPGEGDRLVVSGAVQFLVTIPPDFDRDLVRGQHPQLLVTADATDPSVTGPAINAINEAVAGAIQRDLIGPLAPLAQRPAPVNLVVQRNYNPEGITSHSTVPSASGRSFKMFSPSTRSVPSSSPHQSGSGSRASQIWSLRLFSVLHRASCLVSWPEAAWLMHRAFQTEARAVS